MLKIVELFYDPLLDDYQIYHLDFDLFQDLDPLLSTIEKGSREDLKMVPEPFLTRLKEILPFFFSVFKVNNQWWFVADKKIEDYLMQKIDG